MVSFYKSKEWQGLRKVILAERGTQCEDCKKYILNSKEAHLHHRIALNYSNVTDYNISLNPNNILVLCRDCHDKTHKRFGSYKKEVYLVYGPPLSGKKTYVKEHMERGDLVIDMDSLYKAVSFLEEFNKPNVLYNNVRTIHNTLIDNARTRFGKWNAVWVIGGYADRYKREKLKNDLGAEIVFCDIGKEECLNRLKMVDDYRKDFIEEWEGYIEKWFEVFS